jgi:hypothetical protein
MTSKRASALPLGEPRDDVAGVLLGREQAELRAGAPRRPDDLRRLRENLLDDVQLRSVSASAVPPGVK